MTDIAHGLPHPSTARAFYEGVGPKRLMAWVVDVVLIAIFCVLILPFTAFTGVFFFPILMLVVGFFYRWMTLANKSATWGMRLFGIELRDLSGFQLSSGTAFAHTLGYSISVVTAPLQLISVILMAVTSRGQGLSDHVLGTTAINRALR